MKTIPMNPYSILTSISKTLSLPCKSFDHEIVPHTNSPFLRSNLHIQRSFSPILTSLRILHTIILPNQHFLLSGSYRVINHAYYERTTWTLCNIFAFLELTLCITVSHRKIISHKVGAYKGNLESVSTSAW